MAPDPDSLLNLVQGAEASVDIYRSSFSARSALASELAEAIDWLGANRPQVALAVLTEPTMADAVVFLRVDDRTWLGPLDATGVPRWLEVPVGAEHFTEFFDDERRSIESPPDVLPFSATPRLADGTTLIDDWSRLNATVVDEVLGIGATRWPWACFPPTEDDIRNVVAEAAAAGKKVSMAGKRHSQGGHTFYPGAVVLDMTGFNRILAFDPLAKTIRVQAGTSWDEIQRFVQPHGLSVQVMQAYPIFTVGGALAVNVHESEVIDLALGCGGTYYLPYAAYATAEQSVAAYPGLPRFFAEKHERDPDGVFTNCFLHDYDPQAGGR